MNLSEFIKGKAQVDNMITSLTQHIVSPSPKHKQYLDRVKRTERQKHKSINAINNTFDFEYAKSINNEAWEEALQSWIYKDMVGMYVPQYDPLMIMV